MTFITTGVHHATVNNDNNNMCVVQKISMCIVKYTMWKAELSFAIRIELNVYLQALYCCLWCGCNYTHFFNWINSYSYSVEGLMGAVMSHNLLMGEGQGGSGGGVIESARTRDTRTDSSFFECSCQTYPVSFSVGRVYHQDSCGWVVVVG